MSKANVDITVASAEELQVVLEDFDLTCGLETFTKVTSSRSLFTGTGRGRLFRRPLPAAAATGCRRSS